MTSPEKSVVTTVFFAGTPYEQKVIWPVVRSTEKALLVETAGGQIWLQIWKLKDVEARFAMHKYEDRHLEDLLSLLKTASLVQEVKGVRVQPGDKSVSVECAVIDASNRESKRRFFVPASLLGEDGKRGGKRWVPHSLLAEKLEQWWSLKPPTLWPGFEPAKAQLLTAFRAGRASIQAVQDAANLAARQRRDAKREQQAQAEQVRREAIEEDGELALAFARRRLSLAKVTELGEKQVLSWPEWTPSQDRSLSVDGDLYNIVVAVRKHPDFDLYKFKNRGLVGTGSLLPKKKAKERQPDRVLEHCTVEWSEDTSTSKQYSRVEHRDEGCKVSIYGKKYVIERPDGYVITKMEGPRLKITHTPASAEAEAEAAQ